jgi:hypothetical protein
MFNDKAFFDQAVRASRLAYDLGKTYLPTKPNNKQKRVRSRLYTQQQINDFWFIRDLHDITRQKHPDCQAPDCHRPKHLKNLCRAHYAITLEYKADFNG